MCVSETEAVEVEVDFASEGAGVGVKVILVTLSGPACVTLGCEMNEGRNLANERSRPER